MHRHNIATTNAVDGHFSVPVTTLSAGFLALVRKQANEDETMERKAAVERARPKPAGGASVWAVAALVAWSGVLLAGAAWSGLLATITHHDLLIGALGVSFVLMAFASVALLRQDIETYLSSRDRSGRPRR